MREEGEGKRKSRGITSFYGNATGDCTNAIGSRRTRNGVRRAIESFHGGGGGGGRRKNSHRVVETCLVGRNLSGIIANCDRRVLRGAVRARGSERKKKDHAGSSRGVKKKKNK